MSKIVPITSPGSPSGPVVSPEKFLFDYPQADIILRSGDSYEFRVLKIYIVHISPVLSGRVAAAPHPQSHVTTSADSAVASLPIVQLSDTSGAVLFSLLTYIFPVQPILPSNAEDTIKLLSAAQRYRMDAALTHIRNHVAQQDPPLIREGNSLLVFSIALKHGLLREALQAARSTLELPTFVIESLEERLEMMPCASLYALWQYRRRIRSNFTSLVKRYLPSRYKRSKGPERSGCTRPAASGFPEWLDRYLSSIGRNPSFMKSSRFYMASRDHVLSSNKVNSRRCSHCAAMDIPKLWASLRTIYEASVEEVSLPKFHSIKSLKQFHTGRRSPSFSYSWKEIHVLSKVLEIKHLDIDIQVCLMRMSYFGRLIISTSASIDQH